MIISKPIVTPEFLFENLDNEKLIILDATLTKVSSNKIEEKKQSYQIKRAIFFDIKNVFSEIDAQFPNTVLSPEKFQLKVQELGVNNDSFIIVYDDYGIYSSARVWWMFKLFGFNNIAVLDGGLPLWLAKGFPTEIKQKNSLSLGNFVSSYNSELVRNKEDVLLNIDLNTDLLLDARSEKRFKSEAPEPRKNVRNGHIPKSKSLPYPKVLENERLKSKDELIRIFEAVNSESKDLIFSCGSGITACVLALAAETIGIKNYSVYDGSWTEWGSIKELPISN